MKHILDSWPPISGPAPGLPVWDTPPPPPPFQVHTSGGSTSINLFWESLQEVTSHVSNASEVLQHMQSQCGSAAAETLDSWAHLSWRIPTFHARIRTLSVGLGTVRTSIDGMVLSVQTADENYRTAENSAQRLIELLTRLDERHLIAQHALHPQGDNQLVYDWTATTGVLSGGLGWEVLAMRYPAVSTMAALASATDLDTRLSSIMLDHHQQVLRTEPTAVWEHQGDGTLHQHLDHLAEVSEHGDIAVSQVTTPEGETVYTLFLAGFDANGEPLQEGRGPLSFMDAWSHESMHTADTAEAALDAAGVPTGATVVPIGYSMGGAHVINLVSTDRFTQRYRVPAAATVGSPGRNAPINAGVKMTHLEDARDPTPRLRGESNQHSPERLTISYESHPASADSASMLGSRHSLTHNTEALERIEHEPEAFLNEAEIKHLDALREPLKGSVETRVFHSYWEPRESVEASPAEYAEHLPDAQYLQETLQEAMVQVRSALGESVPAVAALDAVASGEQEPVEQGGDHGDHDRAEDRREETVNR